MKVWSLKLFPSAPRKFHNICLGPGIYTPCPEKNGPPKENAVKSTVYNTIQ